VSGFLATFHVRTPLGGHEAVKNPQMSRNSLSDQPMGGGCEYDLSAPLLFFP
jgi:hypothetical protein